MALPDALALFAYWRRHPPTHEILQAVYGASPAASSTADDPSGIATLLARHPDGVVSVESSRR